MNVEIRSTKSFEREFKRLFKKYKSLKDDLIVLLSEIQIHPNIGIDLGGGVHKIRLAITSKGKGKSGGTRVITFTILATNDKTKVSLLFIYDKSERNNISDKEIKDLISKNGLTDLN